MNRLLTGVILISILFLGCTKDDEPDYATLILGTWVNKQIDNKAILTDASFVIGFRADRVETYATGFKVDDNNKTWIENDKYTYAVDCDKIIINGLNDLGNRFHFEFKILYVDQQILTYSVSKFMIDNVEFPDQKTYTSKKVATNLAKQFVGTWYGKSTTQGTADTSYHYWDYFADGHFDYYYRDGGGNWINKPDNEGAYFLYGDFLASNFTNDLIGGEKGKAFECWNIRIDGNTMFWTGIRENGQINTFRMEKVTGPPSFFTTQALCGKIE